LSLDISVCSWSRTKEKIVKIGPVDTEITLLIVKNKEEEINASKIYSPAGSIAKQAKLARLASCRKGLHILR